VLRRGPNQQGAARRSDAPKCDRSPKRRRGHPSHFVLYVEGARDREILACWARRVDHDLARAIEKHAVILGGRRPARALSDFQKRGGRAAGWTGLVLLDRDEHSIEKQKLDERAISEVDGLEVYVWGQRHIKSYLLVPAVLSRLVGLDSGDRRIERFVEEMEEGAHSVHAKNILGSRGSLSEVTGIELRAGEIARAMRREEFHPDIFELFDRIGGGVGLSKSGPEVVVRSPVDP